MQLIVNNQQDKVEIDSQLETQLHMLVETLLQMEGQSPEAEISLTFVDDEQIRRLNRDYRGLDQPTDVLSFAMRESSDEEPAMASDPTFDVLGDVVISLETAERQSKDYGHSLRREIGYLTVHGVLHLLGYDHQTETERDLMRQKEEAVLRYANLKR